MTIGSRINCHSTTNSWAVLDIWQVETVRYVFFFLKKETLILQDRRESVDEAWCAVLCTLTCRSLDALPVANEMPTSWQRPSCCYSSWSCTAKMIFNKRICCVIFAIGIGYHGLFFSASSGASVPTFYNLGYICYLDVASSELRWDRSESCMGFQFNRNLKAKFFGF